MTMLIWLMCVVLVGGPEAAADVALDETSKAEAVREPMRVDLFARGDAGYACFRIPAVATTNEGTIIAFAEGRTHSCSDTGDIDLVMRRSTDGGKSWSDPAVVWDDETNTCGNPCLVVDRTTGVIWLLTTWNRGDDHERAIIDGRSTDTRRVFVSHSKDDGVTWAQPTEITERVKRPDWTWYATGPGSGIQIEHGPHAGRLVIPCDHIEAETKHYYSHVIHSDDHGATWELGGSTPQHQVNECEVVELADGRLMLNMRNYDRSQRKRQVAFSEDGGATWSGQRFDPQLIEPICQASIERYRLPDDEQAGVILFSNPASAERRERMTVRVSLDEGETWAHERLLHAGGSAYSSLTVLPGGRIGCLYEADGYQRIEFAAFDLAWLMAGEAGPDDQR